MRTRGVIAPLAAWAMSAGCQEVAAPSPTPLSLTMSARVSLYNRTREMHRLEVLSLRQDLVVDCDRLERSPEEVLGVDAFVWPDSPASVELFSGQEVSVDPNHWETRFGSTTPCGAVLIRGEGLPGVIAWWGVGDQVRTVTVDLDAPEELLPAGPAVVLEATYGDERPRGWRAVVCPGYAWPAACDAGSRELASVRPDGASYAWVSAGVRRHVLLDEARDGVRARDDDPRLTWTPRSGSYVYDEVREDAGGCVTFWNDGGQSDIQVCGAPALFRDLEPDPDESGFLTVALNYEVRLSGEIARFDVTRPTSGSPRTTQIVMSRVSGDAITTQGMRWTAQDLEAPVALESTCGQRFQPIALDITWGSFSQVMRAGEQSLQSGRLVHVLRAERGLTRSLVCDPWRRYIQRSPLLLEIATREDL